ncbi:MAG: hypothetical protein AAFS10_19120, partial [Myxococcota bacterium]
MEDFIQQVEQAIATHDLQGALAIAQTVHVDHPERYHVGKALIALAHGDPASLREHIEQAALLMGEDHLPPRVRALLTEARADTPGLPTVHIVTTALDDLLSRDPTGSPGRHPIDDHLDRLERLPLDQAQTYLAALNDSAEPVTAALGKALLAAREGDMDRLAHHVEAIAQDHPDHPRVRSFMVAMDADLVPANALKSAMALLETDDSGRSWEALGSTLFLMGRLSEASQAFDIAAQRDVESTFTLLAVAACEARTGDPIQALQTLDEALDEDPLDPTPLRLARDIIAQLGWAEAALQMVNIDLVERDTLSPTAQAMLEAFRVLVAVNPRSRVLDPEMRETGELITLPSGRGLSPEVQAQLDTVITAAENGDDATCWAVDHKAPLLLKLRHHLALGHTEEAAQTALHLDGADHTLAQALLAIHARDVDAALEHLAAVFAATPHNSPLVFTALQHLYTELGEGVGALAVGEFIEALEEAPHGLVARAMIDTASWALPHTHPALVDDLADDACAFLADLFGGEFDD